MKKKLVALLMVTAMAATGLTACGGKKPEATGTKTEEGAEVKTDGEYQYVSAEDAVKADGVHVVDLREWDNYVAGRVANSEWCPIFPLEDDNLVEVMTDYAKEKLSDGKAIYLVCNSGQRGAQKATGVLKDAGIDEKLIFTVEGGAKALAEVKGALTTNRTEEAIDWQYAKAADVLADKEAQIIDVRDAETYKAGHLKDSLNSGLKGIEDPAEHTAFRDLALETLDYKKPVYLLCYSGNKCAKTGISILKDLGFDADKVFIIENGAKDKDIEAAFVK